MRMNLKIIDILALTLFAVPSAYAQDPGRVTPDTRWTPLVGCWRLAGEDVRAQGASAPVNANAEAVLVCVVPSQSVPGVDITTFVAGQPVVKQTIQADGVSHPVTEPECSGRQTAQWSRAGVRLFTRAELECQGQPKQTVSGAALLVDPATWVDIQSVDFEAGQPVRVRRYRRTTELPEGVVLPSTRSATGPSVAAPLLSGARMTLDDVIEASGKVAPQVLEAAVVETSSQFELDSRALTQLAAAGVSDGVIDVMVALSFPERFSVERRDPFSPSNGYGATAASSRLSGFRTLPGWFGGAYAYYPYGSGYFPYRSYYGYSPYDRFYSYYPYYGGAGSVIGVPGSSAGAGDARVTRGRGYTRNPPNTAVAAPARQGTSGNSGTASQGSASSGSGSSRRAVPRGEPSGGARAGGGAGGGSSAGTRSGSGGGSPSGSGRTARPR